MSISRVSTAHSYDATVRRLQQRSVELTDLQDKLSAGKRVLRASDDPVAASLAERENNRLQRTQADLRALERSRSSLEQAEGALGEVVDSVQRFKELMAQAGNGTISLTDRESIAKEMEGLREQVLNLANTRDANGNALFGGLGATSGSGKPFSPALEYEAIAGQLPASEENVPIRVDGATAFSWVDASNNLFQSMQAAIDAVRTDPATPALQAAQPAVDQGLDNLLYSRGRVGEWLRRADSIDNVLQDKSVASQKEVSDLTDLDMIKGISEFQTKQMAYQAALQSYGQIQKQSLFQYIA